VVQQAIEITVGDDDAEERDDQTIDLIHESLDHGNGRLVGMRFPGVIVPAGSVVTEASIQFISKEEREEPTTLLIAAEASDDAVQFTAALGSISARPRTSAQVTWGNIGEWDQDAAGPGQRTPDISAVVQEVIDREGWQSGNALVLFVTGTGKRKAWSANKVGDFGPVLHLDWDLP